MRGRRLSLLPAALFLLWLLLTQSFSPGQMGLAALAALIGTLAMAALGPRPPQARRPGAVLRLAGIVLVDILRSNLAVAAIVLQPSRPRVSGFVHMSLDLRDRHGLAILALIITATPGTIWVELDRATNILLVHVLDLVDEEAWIELIKRRYETRLIEIFGA